MVNEFFAYSRQAIANDLKTGHCNAAHNREMAVRCFTQFVGGKNVAINELSPCLMTKFEEWLMLNGRKESTARFYLNQIYAIYNLAVKDGMAPKLRLLKSVKTTIPAKQKRVLPSEDELRRMRYADMSDSGPMMLARDIFFFSIYGHGISFTDIAHIKKSDINGSSLTYTSQVANRPRITVQWDVAMQQIAGRYHSGTDYLFPFISSENKIKASREVKRVRENINNALKQIAARCNLSVVPSLYMVKDIYQRAIDSVCVSKIL